MMSIDWITLRGIKILYVDYRGLTPNSMVEQLRKESQIILDQPEPAMYPGNLKNTMVGPDFMVLANQLGKDTEPKTIRSVVVGMRGIKTI